jgi:hypothetical protein
LTAPRSLSVDDLFPSPGHRYISSERMEEMRQEAVKGEPLTLPALDVLGLICDVKNGWEDPS